jgi:hypothetical protein
MKAFKTVLKVIAVASLIGAVVSLNVEDGSHKVFIGDYNIDHIYLLFCFIAWLCLGILLFLYLRKKKDTEEAPKSKVRKVLPVLAACLEMGLTSTIPMVLLFSDADKQERIKSPDGKHDIVRVEKDDWFGNTKYNFYIKDKGVVYRYIFDSDKPAPKLEWTDDGVIFDNKLYEY